MLSVFFFSLSGEVFFFPIVLRNGTGERGSLYLSTNRWGVSAAGACTVVLFYPAERIEEGSLVALLKQNQTSLSNSYHHFTARIGKSYSQIRIHTTLKLTLSHPTHYYFSLHSVVIFFLPLLVLFRISLVLCSLATNSLSCL